MKKIMFLITSLFILLHFLSCKSPNAPEPYIYTKMYWNIYKMNSDGSNIINLSKSEEHNWLSNISPKGIKIIYLINNYSYTMDFDGNDKKFICSSGISYSPDETKILFNKYTGQGYDIYIMNSDGSNPICLTDGTGYNLGGRFSPDGLKIVYTLGESIYTMSIDGDNKTFLTNGSDPQYTKDGSLILYIFSNNLYKMNFDGGDKINLTNDSKVGHFFTISPDGFTIGFHYFELDKDYIVVMDINGSNRRILTEYNQFWGRYYFGFSPDGSQIIYTYNENDYDYIDIYTINSDGSNNNNLTSHISEDCISPIFTKDGSKIIFQKLTNIQND